MKVLLVLWVYLLICGFILGASHNSYHERCGTKGYPSNSDVIASAFLPIALAYVAIVESKNHAKLECKAVKK